MIPKQIFVIDHGNTSQYWTAVKEQKRQGKKVKGLGQN